MRSVNKGAAVCRSVAYAVVAVLCVGSNFAPVQAQETAPAGGPAAIASAGEAVLLRESPGFDAAVLTTLSDGSALEISGDSVSAVDGSMWLPVFAGGLSGYVPAGFVTAAPAPEPVSEVPAPLTEPDPAELAPAVEPDPVTSAPSAAAITTDANLRAWPSADADVMQVLPPGTTVSIDGAAENGFVPVSGNGSSGWVAVELLAQNAEPVAVDESGATSEPAPLAATDSGAASEPAPAAAAPDQSSKGERRESTGIVWPFSGGEWEVVQGYDNGTHINRSNFAQYKYSLDWAKTNGDSAGEPVYAPVSGTIEWVDRGSGGMLVDAGNGYGVAVFHVTLDRGLSSGDRVERGQRIGKISGPGGDGYMSMAHVDMTCWRLTANGHESVPFDGPNTIAGQAFPDNGGTNQHMGATVTP